MVENEVLELDVRRKIYTFIRKSPGLHLREISRLLNIPLSTLDYHLYYLKQRGLILDRQDGRYTRYYIGEEGTVGTKDKDIMGILRQSVTRSIVMYLLLHPKATHHGIAEHIQLAPSTTTFHLNKLIKLEILTREQTGRETRYVIKNAEHLSDLLIMYQKTFLDESVDHFIQTWIGLNPQYVRKQKTP